MSARDQIELGAVVFDSKDTPGTGWACRAGGEPFRIAGVHSLPNGTLWLVNIDDSDMVEAGLAKHAFFRANGFLRLKVPDILRELGLLNIDDEPAEPDVAAYVVASIFERVVRMTCLITGVPRDRWKPHLYGQRMELRQTLIPEDPILDESLADAVRESVQHFTSCQTEGGYRKKLGYLPTMRLAHAQKVLNTPVPTRMDVRRVEPPAALEDVSDWVAQQDGPMLLRVTVEGFPSKINKLINFGGVTLAHNRRPQRGFLESRASTRQWITSDEAMLFGKLGHLTIHEGFVFPYWGRLVDVKPVKRFLGAIDEMDHLSYSLGLFAENLWTGLASSNPSPQNIDMSVNPLTPFLRATDRLSCLEYAIALHDQDYEVRGYGVGRVGALFNDLPGSNDEAVRVAATAGLVPPMPRAGITDIPTPHVVSDDDLYRTLVEMMAGGMRGPLMDVDAEVIEAFEARPDVFSVRQDFSRAAS